MVLACRLFYQKTSENVVLIEWVREFSIGVEIHRNRCQWKISSVSLESSVKNKCEEEVSKHGKSNSTLIQFSIHTVANTKRWSPVYIIQDSDTVIPVCQAYSFTRNDPRSDSVLNGNFTPIIMILIPTQSFFGSCTFWEKKSSWLQADMFHYYLNRC